jgi:hypothetical protein
MIDRLQTRNTVRAHFDKICFRFDAMMTIAGALLQQHIQTLVNDNAQWQKLIADDIVWDGWECHTVSSRMSAYSTPRRKR